MGCGSSSSADAVAPFAAPPDAAEPDALIKAWAAKVKELSERGMKLRAILDFYALLGKSVMLHFDPRRSTTNDVVRQAVIPLSMKKEGLEDGGESCGHTQGVAYAVASRQGKPALAQRMVSHNWGNIFSHLIAAIVADALETPTFGDIVERLSGDGLPALRAELEEKGALDLLYWVCAFCVNQHSCICHGFGPEPEPDSDKYEEFNRKRQDSVVGSIYPLCHCSTEKHFNSSRVQCEMNKFDAMMAHLAHRNPKMKQVVVVDTKLEIFSRAWVVAELVEAHKLKIEQRMKVFDLNSIRGAGQVHRIHVEDCQAARPEDVQEILSKIDDVDAFNKELEKLIFGEGSGLIAGVVEDVRRLEDTSCRVPLFMGRLWKLKREGSPAEASHWFLRDMWITLDGSLCYFSVKENKRLVMISGSVLVGAAIERFDGNIEGWGKHCFEVVAQSGQRFPFACESREEYHAWAEMLCRTDGTESSSGLNAEAAVDKLHSIKLAATNRRIGVSQTCERDAAVFRGKLWKLKVQGDPKNEDDWFLRDVWIAPCGSLNYWSKKEEAALTYFTAADIQQASFAAVAADGFARPWVFEVRRPHVDVFEFAPGVFSAESEESRQAWIAHLDQYSSAAN